MASAASRNAVGYDMAVESIVIASCEWPRTSITTRGGTPWASSNDAQVCRRSWNRMRRTPAAAISWSKSRLRLRGLDHGADRRP